jgi:hypothetical protein
LDSFRNPKGDATTHQQGDNAKHEALPDEQVGVINCHILATLFLC